LPAHRTDTPSRVLLIGPSALGDVCRSVPVLASLRRAFPDAEIDWLVQDTFIEAIRRHPDLTRAVPFPRGLLGRTSRRGNLRPSIHWMNAHLRPKRRYDLVVDAQGLFRSGLFSWWTRARRRVGYANAAELGALFHTECYHVDRRLHAVDRMLALVSAMGVEPVPDMRLYADPDELAWVDGQPWATDSQIKGPQSASDGPTEQPQPNHPVAHAPGSLHDTTKRRHTTSRFAVLAPTSRWPAKQWPADRFAELGRRLLARGVRRLVIVGGPDERDQVRPLLGWANHEPRVTDLVGRTSVARLMAVIARSSLVVANDSAALHMAVGFDRPAVALFGPTRVDLVGPYRRERDVIQHAHAGDTFDHKRGSASMMERITVEDALDACTTRLARQA